MIRMLTRGVILLGFLGTGVVARAGEGALVSTDRVLILAPHPDDEVLACAGVLQKAVAAHLPIKIVFLTNGDNNAWAFTRYKHFPVFREKTMLKMGEKRRQESLAAAGVLGVPAEDLVFLGYPDYGTLALWDAHWNNAPAYKSHMTHVDKVPYPDAYRPGAPYRGKEVLDDLQSILSDFRPTKIFVSDPDDLRPDHRALFLFTRVALWDLPPTVSPQLYTYVVHASKFPILQDLHFHLTPAEVHRKEVALGKHATQMAYSRRFMKSFVREDEIFRDATALAATQMRDARIESWKVDIGTSDVVISGTLPKRAGPTATIGLAVYSYIHDRPFGTMPKLRLSVKSDHGRWSTHVPLSALENPEKILLAVGKLGKDQSLQWENWQLVDNP
jgi:LmbE family N-acetylglucosaminyl deacetylase